MTRARTLKGKKKNNSRKILAKKRPEKKLTVAIQRRRGRSSSGRITVRHKGGGEKKLYRLIEFGQKKLDLPAKVLAIEYDPFRTSFIALVEYPDKERQYLLAPQGIKIGDELTASEKAEIKTGNRMRLKNILPGANVYNIELIPGQGGILARSAGSSAKVLSCEGKFANLELPSKEVRRVSANCFASIGSLSFPEHRFVNVRKAGAKRHQGIRPTVRGSAMNPVDHPHGGGEGRTGIGLKYPKTPWGKHALGVKTRKKKKWTNKFILQRRKKNK